MRRKYVELMSALYLLPDHSEATEMLNEMREFHEPTLRIIASCESDLKSFLV